MVAYLFIYNAGAPNERVERHEFAQEEAAVKSGRSRVGYIDPTVAIQQQPHRGATKPIGVWSLGPDGLPVWQPSR